MPKPAAESQGPHASSPDALLVRALGVRELAAAIFNYTVGSGIFALPAIAVAQLDGAAPLAYIACAIVMACVVLCFAEAGSRVSLTGGAYVYVELALGPLVGFIAGVMLLVTGLTAGAAVTVVLAESVSAFFTTRPAWLPAALMVSVVAALAWINVRGVRGSARTVEVVTVAKLLPLLFFVLVGAAFVKPAHFAWSAVPHVSRVLGTAGIVIFAFSGIESALTPSGEVRAPARTVPRASFLALLAATGLYLAVQWVALGIRGQALAQSGVTPLADAARAFAGTAGRSLMLAGASVSMLGYLSGNLLAVPRSLFAFARDGFLPRGLSSVHARYRTPHVAIVTYALLILALALSGTFQKLAVFSNLTAFVLYILSAIGVWELRRRDVRTAGEPFLVPGGPVIPIAAVVLTLGLMIETAGTRDIVGLALMALAATALYVVRAYRRRSQAASPPLESR
ncbi:MAG TPA: APC family permease [Steroidobacteraceae bacterium]|nr:APC family permease [Steroidobacteraceae bacterium]